MPRKTKDPENKTSSTTKVTKNKKETISKEEKVAKKRTASTSKKTTVTTKKTETKISKKSATVKKNTTSSKNTKTVKSTSAPSKAKATKKSTKTTKRGATKKASTTNKVISYSPEYYDLPFRYNKTVVKLLAQTPTNLFVYWEISDEDRELLKNQFGKYFFEITKPVLIVYNETKNYSFEIDINDFANSWYIHVEDSKCEYKIELGRRPIPINYNYIPQYNEKKDGKIKQIETPYIYISSSNELEAPNDQILFNNQKIYFKNLKTNKIIEKDITDFPFVNKNNKFISIYKLYLELYKEEIVNNHFDLSNPSSGNISSGSFSSKFN